MRNLFCRLAAIAFVFSIGSMSYAQSAKFDTSYISDKSFLVLRFDIAKLVAMEKMGSKNIEVISKGLQKNVGLSLENMKAITMQFGNKDEGPFENAFSITMEQKKPIDKDAMHKAREISFERLTEAEYGGKKYLRHNSDGGPHIYFSNDRTVSWATAKAIENLIDAEKGNGEMASQIKTAPPGSEVQAAFRANDGFEQFLDQFDREFGFFFKLPEDVAEFISDAKTGVGSISTSSSTPLHIQLQFGSADSAGGIKENLDKLVQLGKASIPFGVSALEDELERLKEEPKNGFRKTQIQGSELGLKALGEAKKLIEGVDVAAKQKTLTIKIKQMGGIKHVVPMVSDMFAMMFAEFQRFEDGVDRAIEAKKD